MQRYFKLKTIILAISKALSKILSQRLFYISTPYNTLKRLERFAIKLSHKHFYPYSNHLYCFKTVSHSLSNWLQLLAETSNYSEKVVFLTSVFGNRTLADEI